LHITNIISSNPAFTNSFISSTIVPSGSDILDVTFSPGEYQSYNESLQICSDADTLIVNLEGMGYTFAYENATVTSGIHLTDYSMSSSWADYDQDGYEDLFIVNSNSSCKLFKNNGDGTFTDRTVISFININGPAYGSAWADYDNDGDVDLYVSLLNQPNQLYQNQGDGTFFEMSSFAGVNDNGPSKGVTWSDYNNDSYVDLFVSNYGTANKLYQNQGDGTFVDVAAGLGLDHPGQGQIGTWIDYDLDGDPDLYLVNWNNQPNLMYRNEDGASFTEVGSSLGIAGAEKSKSASWGDYDNDGDPDLYLVNYLGQPNKLFRNDLSSGFTDVSVSSGTANDGYGNGSAWLDYNNYFYLDLFLVTFNNDQNIMYKNMGDGTFENFSLYAGVDNDPIAKSVAFSDYNKDGYADLYVTVANDTNIVYKNILDINHWLNIELIGTQSNTSAIGAFMGIWAGNNLISSRMVHSGEGYFAGNCLKQSIGTGTIELIDSLVINWPSGIRQVESDI